LFFLGRIGTFQGVTANPNKKTSTRPKTRSGCKKQPSHAKAAHQSRCGTHAEPVYHPTLILPQISVLRKQMLRASDQPRASQFRAIQLNYSPFSGERVPFSLFPRAGAEQKLKLSRRAHYSLN
jgi:hypothetical protein